MSNLTLNHKTGKVYAYATKEEMHKFLASLTDEDFNGNNGEDYFEEVETPTGPKLMSALDKCMKDYNVEKSIQDKKKFIFSVIDSNYICASCYKDHDINVDNINDYITVSVAILED